jgi:hypothetical protein
MLLTANKRWNYFITLPPAAREDVLPVLSPSPMRRRLCDNVIVAVVVVVVVVNCAVAINVVVVVVVVHCAIAVVVLVVAVHRAVTIVIVNVVQNHHPRCRPLPLPSLLLLPRNHHHCNVCRRHRIPLRSPPPGRCRCPCSRRSPPLLFCVGCHPAAVVFGGGTGVAGRVRRLPRRPPRPPCVHHPVR